MIIGSSLLVTLLIILLILYLVPVGVGQYGGIGTVIVILVILYLCGVIR